MVKTGIAKRFLLFVGLLLYATAAFAQPSYPPVSMQYNGASDTVMFVLNVTSPLGGSCSGSTCTATLSTGSLTSSYMDYSLTTGASLSANQCYWAALGIICEGSSADGNETYLQFANSTANNVITFPNETGTVCTNGSVCTGYMGTGTQIGTSQNSNIHANDNVKRYYGTDSDWWRMYDETNNDQLFDATNKTGAGSTSVPMYALLVDASHSNGSSLTANQNIFGLCKGTETTNKCVFLVDAEGDVVFNNDNAHTIKVADAGTGNHGTSLTISGGSSVSANTNGGDLNLSGGNGVSLGAGGAVNITSGGGLIGGAITIANGAGLGADITLNASSGTINLYNGVDDVIAPSRAAGGIAGKALTLRSGGSTSATNNLAAGDAILGAGASTGTGNATVRVQGRARATATASSDNGINDRIVVTGAKGVTDATLTSIVDINISASAMVGGTAFVTCESTNGTEFQAITGQVSFSGVNKAGTMTCTGTELGADVVATSTAGSPTIAFDATTGTAKCTLRVNCDQTLSSPSTGYPRVTYSVILNSGAAVTVTPL